MYRCRERIDFKSLGREKTVVFLAVSDTDRAMDGLVSVFYTQALQVLCGSADRDYPDHRLPVPVRFILDDFATNVRIPDFDKIISVIRSREISVSVILQSISQLSSIYGQEAAMTIINNCDNCLYLGGQDVETARYIAVKANKTADTILNMPLDRAYLFTRGTRPKLVEKYDICTHEAYSQLREAVEKP
jgi:type IV secretion system protein VirD4